MSPSRSAVYRRKRIGPRTPHNKDDGVELEPLYRTQVYDAVPWYSLNSLSICIIIIFIHHQLPPQPPSLLSLQLSPHSTEIGGTHNHTYLSHTHTFTLQYHITVHCSHSQHRTQIPHAGSIRWLHSPCSRLAPFIRAWTAYERSCSLLNRVTTLFQQWFSITFPWPKNEFPWPCTAYFFEINDTRFMNAYQNKNISSFQLQKGWYLQKQKF